MSDFIVFIMCREGAMGYRWLVKQGLREEGSSSGVERLLKQKEHFVK